MKLAARASLQPRTTPKHPETYSSRIVLVLRRPIHAGAALVAWKRGALLLGVVLAATGCAHKTRTQLPPAPSPRPGTIETGIASWYGEPYNGRRAANGEIYDMERLSAAHRTLPFDTWVEVNDLDNGKRVDVRITDRGPFVAGRIIDLSRAAARELDMLGPGIARVRLTVIENPRAANTPPATQQYLTQAGAFSDRAHADKLAGSLRDRFDNVRVESFLPKEGEASRTPVWRVLVGRDLTLDDANQLAGQVREIAGEAMVVKER
jgi:rare lipoprotein A